MTKLHIFTIAAIVALAALTAITGCSKKSDSDNAASIDIEQTNDALMAAVESHDRKNITSMIDELALNADDLSPEKGVSVLMGYYEMYNQYNSERRTKQAMETMRNFVDVYDIVNANHKENFKRALKRTNTVYPDVDFEAVYSQFLEKLSNYDGSPVGSSYDEETPVDSATEAAVDSVAPELAPEFRPAE